MPRLTVGEEAQPLGVQSCRRYWRQLGCHIVGGARDFYRATDAMAGRAQDGGGALVSVTAVCGRMSGVNSCCLRAP